MAESLRFGGKDIAAQLGIEEEGVAGDPSPSRSPIILVVSRDAHIAGTVMNYTVNLAARLQRRLLVAYVDTLPHFSDGGKRQKSFTAAVLDNTAVYKEKAASRGVDFDYVRESGKIGKVVNRLCHIVKRIDFVVVDKGIKMEEAVARIPVPVFNVRHGNPPQAAKETWHGDHMFLARITRR